MILKQTKAAHYMDNIRRFLPSQAHYLRNHDLFVVYYFVAIVQMTENQKRPVRHTFTPMSRGLSSRLIL